ncbi:hypothetical protein [Cupriavidus basilensis]|uniref:Uncharacterized protein n=1 Tax=Cupriavidus basilensis TaxID=68895 RepID=A0A643FMQ3_9BURK|nr:hypothetical protein [Cupriavidus basilensis]QOT77915.1 hypothetical protein F7R26_007805 [Cupriavidus basilensis]
MVWARIDLVKGRDDNQTLADAATKQNAAVADLAAQAKICAYAAAKADAEAQAAQSKYTLLAGKIQAQTSGADQCASLHGLWQTFTTERRSYERATCAKTQFCGAGGTQQNFANNLRRAL